MAHGWLVARTKGCSLARVVCQSPPCDLAGRYVYEEEAVRTGTHEHEGTKEGRKGLGFPVSRSMELSCAQMRSK